MATLSRAAIAAVLSLVFQDSMQDQFRRDVVLGNLLEVEDGKNENCTWTAKFDGRTAGGAYTEGADMADGDYDSHNRVRASLNWAEYRTGAKVSGLAQAVGSASGLGDTIGDELVDAVDELALLLGAAMYAGDPTATPMELAGLAAAVDATAGTFAGLATATYADWVGSEQSLATASLSVKNLREKLFRPVKNATGMDPDVALCAGAVFDLIKDLLGEKAETVQEISTARGRLDLTQIAGARAMIIDGVPFLEDRHCTANTIYGIHTRYLKIRQVPAAKSRLDPTMLVGAMKALIGVDIDVTDIEARLRARKGRLTPTIEVLAQTGDAYKFMVKWYGQLVIKRRNAHGKLTLT
jgi:hypothetical protein